MNADGSGQRNLTRNATDDWGPVWSPDGRTIAFQRSSSSHGNETVDVYVMNADGSDQQNLTQDSTIDRDPVWLPAARRK